MTYNYFRPGTKVRAPWPGLRRGTVIRNAEVNGQFGYMVRYDDTGQEQFAAAHNLERLPGGAR